MATEEAQQRREEAGGPAGKAQEAATQAKEQVQQKADEVRGKASVRVREQLDERSTQLAEQVSPFGEALRRAAQHLQSEGNGSGATAANRAAEQVERLSAYLQRSGSERLLADLERFGRRRPWAAGAAGLVAGFVGARFLKASSESRYATSYRPPADVPLALPHADGGAGPVPQRSPYASSQERW